MKHRALWFGAITLITAVPLVAGAAPAAKARAGAARPLLKWQDLQGRSYAASRSEAASVLVFGSTTCPCADGYNSRLLALAERYQARNTRFFLVFSTPGVSRAEVEKYIRSRKIPFPVVHDADGRLAKRLAVAATPTAVLLKPDGGVAYRGRIDDSPEPVAVRREYLREALDAVLAAKPVTVAQTRAIGCSVSGKKAEAAGGPVLLAEGIGKVTFPVTANAAAQPYFAQGMARWYGFNFPEAERSFREALRRDPDCAMAHWGLALTLGMNFNVDFDPARVPEGRAAIRKAVSLLEKVTPKERALIQSMALRYDRPEQEQSLEPYREEMARVCKAYPEDLNVAVLYAAAIMDLRPWKLWTKDGRPEPGTPEALQVLEDVLRRDPNHIGANHYYIHLTEASPNPERALPSARRLADLAPQSGHLVHMPAHTYIRVGDFLNSAVSNNRAASIDRAYFAREGKATRYVGYYVHNLDFLIASYLMDGRAADAVETARKLADVTAAMTPEEKPIWCGSASGVLSVYARSGKWDEILKAAAPSEMDPFTTTMWRYARGMACVARRDLSGAERELRELEKVAVIAEGAVPAISVPGFTESFKKSYAVTVPVLAGKVALWKGNGEEALRLLREAVAIEDSMPYYEPATWRYPVREALGGALLKLGRPAEAETAFREDLKRNARNGRSLFGLMHALDRQGKKDEAARVREQFTEVWQRADMKLTPEDL